METMTFNFQGKAMSLHVYTYEREAYRRVAESINGVTNISIA